MGEPGVRVVEHVLPALKAEHAIDVVIAQAENVSEGKGLSLADYDRLKLAGVDGFSGGDHTIDRGEIYPLLEDPDEPVVGPVNMRECPGPGYKYLTRNGKRVLFVSLLGNVVGRYADREIDNPLKAIDAVLETEKHESNKAIVVNFHGDYSSEKRVIGHYLDGRVAVVVGDHWHVPSADAEILPAGTAHITDVGMCGSLDSSLGVSYDIIVKRWLSGEPNRNQLETEGRMQFNALLVAINDESHGAKTVQLLQKVFPEGVI